jgi:hypothetical protein
LEGGINLFVYVGGNPVGSIDPFGLAEHHIVPKAIWQGLSGLSKEASDIFNKAVVEAGEHYNWDIHREYSKYINDLWKDFFKGVKPCEITKEAAEDFVKFVKSDPKAKGLLAKLLQRGGAPIPSWLGAGASIGGRIAGGVVTAILMDMIFPSEAY